MSRSVTPPKTISRMAVEGDEGVDAVGVEQPAATNDEDAGQKLIIGDGAGEAGKVGEGRVGGERQRDGE